MPAAASETNNVRTGCHVILRGHVSLQTVTTTHGMGPRPMWTAVAAAHPAPWAKHAKLRPIARKGRASRRYALSHRLDASVAMQTQHVLNQVVLSRASAVPATEAMDLPVRTLMNAWSSPTHAAPTRAAQTQREHSRAPAIQVTTVMERAVLDPSRAEPYGLLTPRQQPACT
jgi:hypothetical protein